MPRQAAPAALLCAALTVTAACGTGEDTAAPTPTSTTAGTSPASPLPATTTTPTAAPASPTTPPPSNSPPEPDRRLGRGDRGAAVESLQRRLAALDYWVGPVDGVFGHLTEQAVYAVQGAAGISRDGVVGPRTRLALAEKPRPRARSDSGYVVEVDRDRQLLLLVEDGRVERTFHTSTGTFERYTYGGETYLADTPAGRWEIFRQVNDWDPGPLGRLYMPKYFHEDGIAVHGYPNVPAYPASHGCVRVSLAAIEWMWRNDRLPIGATVWVY